MELFDEVDTRAAARRDAPQSAPRVRAFELAEEPAMQVLPGPRGKRTQRLEVALEPQREVVLAELAALAARIGEHAAEVRAGSVGVDFERPVKGKLTRRDVFEDADGGRDGETRAEHRAAKLPAR